MPQQSLSLRYHPKPRRPRTSKETSHKSCETLSLIMHLELLFQAHHTNTWPWTQDIHAPTNLPARGPASTYFLARSLTLRISPPVVQHTWSNIYESPGSKQPSSESSEYTNLPARILTSEHHNMNLPAHIIMCSPLAMNPPAHDIFKRLLVQAQHHKHAKHRPTEPTTLCAIAWSFLASLGEIWSQTTWRSPHAARRHTPPNFSA